MNLDLIVEIAELANSLVQTVRNGNADATTVTSTLLQILQQGAQAYEQQTGAALDPSLIRAEAFPS
jgi:hypothetical protein